tara:strand:- start:1321 stop:2295 length:975 start_codon:yes stop_codon:yes gene_type:complete
VKNLKIRKYKKGDEKGFFALDRKIEEHKYNRRTISNFLWKYKGDNCFGKSINYFAENNGQIIAHFGAIPLNWNLDSKNIKGGCSIAMMVSPEWQSKGLIKFVGDKVFDDLIKEKVKFVYGYPNERSYLLHKNIWNYKDAFNQDLYLIDNSKINTTNEKNFFVIKIKKFNKSFDLFWKKNKKDYKNILNRTSKFLNWRYLKRPDKKYYPFLVYDGKELLGYFILKRFYNGKIKTIHIIDMFFKNISQPKFYKLFKALFSYIKKNQKTFDKISLWINGSRKIRNSLLNLGFKVTSSRKMIYKNLSNEKNLNLKKMYFTMGDTLEIY